MFRFFRSRRDDSDAVIEAEWRENIERSRTEAIRLHFRAFMAERGKYKDFATFAKAKQLTAFVDLPSVDRGSGVSTVSTESARSIHSASATTSAVFAPGSAAATEGSFTGQVVKNPMRMGRL